LRELGVPVNVVVLHDNLLLAVGFCCWRLYAIRIYFFTRRKLLSFLLLVAVYSLVISIYNDGEKLT